MTKAYEDKYNQWRGWPQVKFKDELFEEVGDWVMNRFGYQPQEEQEVVLAYRGHDSFRVAIKDSQVLSVTLLKFECELLPSEVERERNQIIERAKIDAEIKRLTTELQAKVSVVCSSYEQYIKEAIKEDGVFSYDNGVWTNVKE